MAAPRTGPCAAWATESDLCSPCDDYSFPSGELTAALLVASGLLFEWSARRFAGSCTATVRPCTRGSVARAVRFTGDWDGTTEEVVCGCQRGRPCGCSTLDEITLGGYPVTAVTQVRVRMNDGGILTTLTSGTHYRVDDYRYLVRLPDADGTNPGWPCCQDLAQDASGDGVYFDVTLTYGVAPPPAGVRAAAALGCELALACTPESVGKCRLPRRTQQIARAGVTISLIDPSELFTVEPGKPVRTGLWEVDAFLSAYNPSGLKRRAQLISPLHGRRVRRAGT